ncbi:hypothetical protein [Spirosoma aerophilum]
MKTTLDYLQAELHLRISTLCMHLRNKAYPQKSQAIYDAMSSLVYFQILVDELDKILWHLEQLNIALNKALVGENFNATGDEDATIYEYCLFYFRTECGLGTSTPELSHYVATHADRNQTLRRGFYSFFSDIDMQVADEGELRPVTDAELFEANTESFLRDIEASNSLIEFNQFMATIKAMLEAEAPVADILTTLNAEDAL